MADLIVNGGKPLSGTIVPSGNKNSALPILCATLLAGDPVRLLNVPDITDLEKLVGFFTAQGSRITWDRAKGEMRVDHANFSAGGLQVEMPAGMRSTVLLLAPLLGRMKKLIVPANAKGCSLGIRELDPHFEILQALGATRADIVREVFLSGGRPGVRGRFIGLWLSVAMAASLRQNMSGTPLRLDSGDPLLYGGAALLLATAAVLAMSGPARRGSNANPLDALRCD